MNPIYPLNKKLELDRHNILDLQNTVDECQRLIEQANLKACGHCGADKHVEIVPWTHPNPEHDDNAVITQCQRCQIQTQPQYWFISSPSSAINALQASIDCWNNRPVESQLPSMEADQ